MDLRKPFEIFITPKGGKPNPKAEKAIEKVYLANEDKRLKVTIRRAYKKRSNQQSRYYWGCVLEYISDCMFEFTGEKWSKDRSHDFCKCMFFGETKVNPDTGTIITLPKSSTTNTTIEFEEVMEKIRQFFAQEFAWVIPLPGEAIEMDFNEKLDTEYRGE